MGDLIIGNFKPNEYSCQRGVGGLNLARERFSEEVGYFLETIKCSPGKYVRVKFKFIRIQIPDNKELENKLNYYFYIWQKQDHQNEQLKVNLSKIRYKNGFLIIGGIKWKIDDPQGVRKEVLYLKEKEKIKIPTFNEINQSSVQLPGKDIDEKRYNLLELLDSVNVWVKNSSLDKSASNSEIYLRIVRDKILGKAVISGGNLGFFIGVEREEADDALGEEKSGIIK